MKRRRITAGELIQKLDADPEYVARREKRTREIEERAAIYERAERSLVKDLRAAGANVSSVWDLVNLKASYPPLVPILFDHLAKPYPAKVREGIARALAVREARSNWRELVQQYLAEPNDPSSQVKWALHLAIGTAANFSVLDELIDLALDKRHRRNRAYFVNALARMNDPRAEAAIEELANDPDLKEDVRKLQKRRARNATRRLERK
jgi:hypothetical protein